MVMKNQLHIADSRGLADHGWLFSRHTFSFADYYAPQRMNFGLLRVLNDDIVKPSMGFPTHPHENMEIVSIPLSGSLRHQDSMGNKHVITSGEVQVMSAGTGLTHSEYNNSDKDDVIFLQIWVYPKEKNIAPRYGQKLFNTADRLNRFQTLVSPEKSSESIWINQEAYFSMAGVDAATTISYQNNKAENGLYFFIIEGQVEINSQKLKSRDGFGLTQGGNVKITALSKAQLLCIEVPLNNG
jgi:redox-sensitive bicupin YhaK (pirin superfamily)